MAFPGLQHSDDQKNSIISSLSTCPLGRLPAFLASGFSTRVSDLIDPSGSLSITNPRLEHRSLFEAASTLVPLIVWADVCTDVCTAPHLCSEGIPHPPRVPHQFK